MDTPLCTIQKKERINFLTEQYVFQSCLLTAQDNSKIKFDISKLSSISPLIRSILTSFSVPVFLLGTVDIILPDVSVEELKTLHHLTSVRSSEEDGLCLSMDNWHKLQSLLDTLDSNEEKNNEESSDDIAILENSTDPSQDGNKNTLTLIDALNTDEIDSDKGSSSKTNRLVSILKTHEKTSGGSESQSRPKHSSEKKTRELGLVSGDKFLSEDDEVEPVSHQSQRRLSSWGYPTKTKSTSSYNTGTKPGPASLKPMPFSKKKENLETASMTSGSVGRNQSVEIGEVRGKSKSKPLSMKTESHENDSDEILDLMNFFNPSNSKSSSKGKTGKKRATSCGRCANCQINKQIKR